MRRGSRAYRAAEAAQCAGDQGRFWEFHDKVFANSRSLLPADFLRYAAELELDREAFAACLEKGKAGGIREDLRVARALGIGGTPAYVLGRRIQGGDKVEVLEILAGAVPFEVLETKIEAHLAGE